MSVVLNDVQGRPLLPSLVAYAADGSVEVGYKAEAKQSVDPKNTIISVKRFMGRGRHDIAHIESLPYDFVDTDGMVKLKTIAGVKSPVEISAEILKTVRNRAEASLDRPRRVECALRRKVMAERGRRRRSARGRSEARLSVRYRILDVPSQGHPGRTARHGCRRTGQRLERAAGGRG